MSPLGPVVDMVALRLFTDVTLWGLVRAVKAGPSWPQPMESLGDNTAWLVTSIMLALAAAVTPIARIAILNVKGSPENGFVHEAMRISIVSLALLRYIHADSWGKSEPDRFRWSRLPSARRYA